LSRHRRLSSNFWPEAAFPSDSSRLAGWPPHARVSTEILLEYQEIITRLSGAERWRAVAALLELLAQLHGNIRHVETKFRFNVISTDPDDNKFCDCAIAAEANFVIAEDHHFDVLKSAGYKPKPITPEEFIRQHLPA
jgi:putative PIN family toxin of toxin-antitoxin system